MLSFGLPTVGNGTFATSQAFACCLRPAVLAVLGVFARSGKFTAMQFFVTGNAKGYPVGSINGEIGMFRQWLNVVCVQVSLMLSTRLTGEIISFVNGHSPLFEIVAEFCSQAMRGFSAFPYRRCFACAPFNHAIMGTELGSMVYGIKVLSASDTLLDVGFSSIAPTCFRAVFGSVGSVCQYLKIFAAHFAFGSGAIPALRGRVYIGALWRASWLISSKWVKFFAANLAFAGVAPSFCHGDIISHHSLCANYVAVALQRWADHTGRTPELAA